jgi:hypothetical protein
MWIMNIVWPVNGLLGTLLTLLLYYRFGRLAARDASELNKRSSVKKETPFSVMVAKGAMHCGAGCTLGDIVAESLVLAFPAIAIWARWKTLFSEKMFAIWVVDYLFAFVLGVAFQYFTIKPMRDLSPSAGIVQAVKADTLSLTAWQVGMYAARYLPEGPRGKAGAVDAGVLVMMQIAMIGGFLSNIR